MRTLGLYAQQRFMVFVVRLQHSIKAVVNRRSITQLIRRNLVHTKAAVMNTCDDEIIWMTLQEEDERVRGEERKALLAKVMELEEKVVYIHIYIYILYIYIDPQIVMTQIIPSRISSFQWLTTIGIWSGFLSRSYLVCTLLQDNISNL